MALMKSTSPSSARSRIRRRVGTVVARKRNLNLDGKGNEMNDDLLTFGWWAENTLKSCENCDVVRIDEPTYLENNSIARIANLFNAKAGCDGGKIHVYTSGGAGRMEGIAGCWLWTLEDGDNEQWKLRITDDDRDVLVIIKNKRYK
jgi:hypothetical protein